MTFPSTLPPVRFPAVPLTPYILEHAVRLAGEAAFIDGTSGRTMTYGELEAVRRGQVFAVDGSAYFSRPGPRIVDGIELLAEIFDPDTFVDLAPIGSWTPLA